jgi:hypothetical protein
MFPILFRRIRKSLFVVLPLALLAGYAVHDALSHYRGVAYCAVPLQQDPGCNATATPTDACHGAVPSPVTVIHVLMPDTIYAGNTYIVRISVANPDPIDVAAGFDVDIDSPAMLDTVAGMITFLSDSLPPFLSWWDIHHTAPQSFTMNGPNSDSAVWSIQYTARPTPGFDTFYVDGNAVDGDSASPSIHDHWDSLTQIVTVLPAPSIVTPALSSNVLQVYPNPASNEIFINDGIPTYVGTYTLTDASGRVVLYGRQFPLDGSRSIDISSIAAGAYFLNVQPRMGRTFTRSVAIHR